MRMTVSLHAHRRHRHRAMTMMTMIRCLFSSPLTPGGVTGTELSPIWRQVYMSRFFNPHDYAPRVSADFYHPISIVIVTIIVMVIAALASPRSHRPRSHRPRSHRPHSHRRARYA